MFTLSTYTSYKLYDKTEHKDIGVKSVLGSIKKIFDVDNDELIQIFDEWSEKKAIELNNKVADLRYKIHAATGLDVELTVNDLNKLAIRDADGTPDIKSTYNYLGSERPNN